MPTNIDNDTVVLEKTRTNEQIAHPKNYNVIMWNDDVTPMDFVVIVLMEAFGKNMNEAINIMISIHNSDKGLVGTYPMDEAYSRVDTAENLLAQIGCDTLCITVEEA